MGLSVLPGPDTLDRAAALIQAMMDPAKAKVLLDGVSEQLATLHRLRDEVTAMQQKADADRAAADQMMADLARREAALAAQNAALDADRAALAAWREQKRKMAADLAEIAPLPPAA